MAGTCVSCAFCAADRGPRLFCLVLGVRLSSVAACGRYARSCLDGLITFEMEPAESASFRSRIEAKLW